MTAACKLMGGVAVSEFVSAVPPPECTTPFLVNEYDNKDDNDGNDCWCVFA